MRVPFDTELDPNEITISVDSVGTMTTDQLNKLVEIFNRFGIVAVDSKNTAQPDSDLLSMSSLFGRVAPHKLANKFGIYDIRPESKEKPSYPGTSWKEHPLHTDGAFQDTPERVGCLQCVQAAKTGGVSTLASGSLIYQKVIKHLSQKDLMCLFEEDAIFIERDGELTKSSIFFHFDGKIGIRFRKDEFADIKVSNNAQRGYELICNIIADEQNVLKLLLKPGVILVFDNYGVLHGRTEFDPNDYRHYKRINCFGDGRLSNEICFGVAI